MKKGKIAVIGGAGFIGSYVNKLLCQKGYETVVFDNLSKGSLKSVVCGEFMKGDLGKEKDLKHLFSTYQPDAVMHFAAYTDVGESTENPLIYYQNNFSNTLNLIESMLKYQVNTLIFSSTAAVYGSPKEDKIKETHPLIPINPYGRSKLMVEKALKDFSDTYGLKYCSLRYFNAAGGDPDGEIQFTKKTGLNFIPIVLRNILQSNCKASIFGTDYPTPDGTCIRDYIHLHDLATAHILALEKLLGGSDSCHYNLGNGQGFSVTEVVDTIEKITGKELKRLDTKRRSGDPARLIANAEKAQREMGWYPEYGHLETMVSHAWNVMK